MYVDSALTARRSAQSTGSQLSSCTFDSSHTHALQTGPLPHAYLVPQPLQLLAIERRPRAASVGGRQAILHGSQAHHRVLLLLHKVAVDAGEVLHAAAGVGGATGQREAGK